MSIPAYSSLTAFLAHRQVLRARAAPNSEEAALLAQMDALIAELRPTEREALDAHADSGERARHRERAERHLEQILGHRGVLPG